MTIRRVLRVAAGGLVIATVGAAGLGLGLLSSGIDTPGAEAPYSTAPPDHEIYESAARVVYRNHNGQTYGSMAAAENMDEVPDLIAAIATNGQYGYVAKEDFFDPVPADPEAATREYQRGQVGAGREIPVYDASGARTIGVFIVQPPS
jgi:hypothetical protein